MPANNFAKFKILANKHPFTVFDALGMTYSERYHYINGVCPVHEGDRKDAFSWHIEKGIWKCFSRGCHDEHGKDIYGLICGVLNCSKGTALAFLEKLFKDKNVSDEEMMQVKEARNNRAFVDTVKHITKYDDSVLDMFEYNSYLEGRGFPRKLVEDYHIGYAGNGFSYMSNRIIVPIRDMDGAIVGFSGRTIFEDWKERGIPKWCDSKGFVKTNYLFNMDKAKTFIEESSCAILVEGPFDVLRMEQAGIHNSVAALGRKLHNSQIGLLLSTGCSKLIIMFDNDVPGQTGASSSENLAAAFFKIEKCITTKKDAGESSVDELREIFPAFAS